MAEIKKLKNLEKGMYEEAAKSGKSFSVWLEDHITTNEGGAFEPTPYKGLTQFEVAQKRRALKANGQDIPPTAYELALAANEIKAFGAYTDRVGKFFQNSNTTVLFPEYIQNRVYAGALQASIIQNFVAETVVIEGLDFKKIYLQDTEADRQTSRVTRGGEAPKKHIKVGKESVALEKYMVNMVFDYESVYDTPLNLYSLTLQRVGQQIGIDESDDMVYAMINGDGNSNGLESAQTENATTSGAIEKLDIIKLASALPLPYKLDVFVGKKAYMQKFWDALSDMQNPAAQWGQTGMQLPMGFEWDRNVLTSDYFIGLDSNLTMGYVTNDTVMMTETDRIIAKQQVETVVSKRGKFNILDQDGIGALDIET